MVVAIRCLLLAVAGLLATIAHAQTTVQSIAPADGATGIAISTNIVVTFSAAMDGASLTSQTATGACSQTIQVSNDGFATCIGFSSALASTVGAVATLTPAAALAHAGTYRVRVLAAARSVALINLAADFTQASGFTTVPITLIAVQSRKTHGAAGPFDIKIDTTQGINGVVTLEPRAIGSGHTIVFQFDGPVTAPGTVTAVDEMGAPVGNVAAAATGNDVVVTLNNVPDKQRVALALSNVNNAGVSAAAAIGFFVGGVSGFGVVSAADILQVKSRSGQAATPATFRHDLNASGAINASDIVTVKRRSNVVFPVNYTVGGTVAGLTGTVVLQNNGADNLSLSANGAFTFPTLLATGAGYAVTVSTQPVGQSCAVANAAGTIASTNVGNVIVTCSAATYNLSGTVSGSVAQNVIVALSGARGAATTTDANGNFSFSGLLPGNYTVTPMLSGHTFTPANRSVAISNAHSTANGFVAAVATVNPSAPVIGIFPDSSFVNMAPAQRDPFDGTKVLHRYTLLVPDNCPQQFTVANLGPPNSTLNYQVVNEDFVNGFVYINGNNGIIGGSSIPVTFSMDPQFTTGPFGGPSLSLGSTQILSIFSPQASNNTKSVVSVDIRSPADQALGTWAGTWSGLSYANSNPGSGGLTTPVNGNWTLQVDSIDLSSGVIGGSLTWTGTDAVWSNDAMTPIAFPVSRVITFTPVNTLVQATNFGCGLLTIAFNRDFTNPPSSYGPNGFLTINIPGRSVDMSSHFHANPVWPSTQTGYSGGNLVGTKISP